MSYVRLLFVGLMMSSTGCSFLIMHAGKDLSELENKEAVHEKLGLPDEREVNEHGSCEIYRTHWKIAEPFRATSQGLYWSMSLGLLEFTQLPVEIYRLGYRTVNGQEIRFSYDPSGRVVGVKLDGDGSAIRPSSWHLDELVPPESETKKE